jgi:hypothetical protein
MGSTCPRLAKFDARIQDRLNMELHQGYNTGSYVKENKVNACNPESDSTGMSSSGPYLCVISRNLSASWESHS